MAYKVWPDLTQIWCFDNEYISVSKNEVMETLTNGWWINMEEIKAENADCDDVALQQHAKVKRYVNWPFGEAFANKVNAITALHNLNICFCRDGIILVDSNIKRIWEPNTQNDNILWVRI